jgi:hypothetical protein
MFSRRTPTLPQRRPATLPRCKWPRWCARRARPDGSAPPECLRSYLSAAFTAGKKAPFDASLPAALIPFEIERNPVDSIPAIAVRAGNRTLSADELRAYLNALGDDLADQALLLALLAGGQRMAQLLRAK